MYLEDLYDYKNQFMKDILTNQDIVNLIANTTDKLASETTPFDGKELLYSQVFPFEYIPDTVEVGKSYVFCDVDIQSTPPTNNGLIYLPILYVWVLSHKSILRLPNGGGVRTDAICSEIEKTIEGKWDYGMGKMTLYAVKRFSPMIDFNGKVMIYHMKEIKRVYDPSKPIPSNRKEG